MNDFGPPPVIKLDHLKKVFVTDEVETHALDDINLEIERGEYVSISGPSGCGKSTLLSILGLLDSPTEGQYFLNGRPVAELRPVPAVQPSPRPFGLAAGAFTVPDDFDALLPEEILREFEGR